MARDTDNLFGAYEHLHHLPRAKEALQMVKRAASLVKPIMRKRGWRVGTLCEFLPAEPNLLGLNFNKGERILLRVRYHNDTNQFMPYENIVDTLLHELSHIVHGPHDAVFQRQWDELRAECEALIAKGYTGEGFMGKGQVVGGHRMPVEEAHRVARRRAEEEHSRSRRAAATLGNILGGRRPTAGSDIRNVIANAADRRSTVNRGCPTENTDVINLTDRYGHGGHRIAADENDADNDEITRALIDLLQNDEERKLNGLPPLGSSRDAPITIQDSPQSSRAGARNSHPPPPIPANRPPLGPIASRSVDRHGRPLSRLVTESENRRPVPTMSSRRPAVPQSPQAYPQRPSAPTTPVSAVWSCAVCTLDNLLHHEKCEACENPRPAHVMGNFDYGQWINGGSGASSRQRDNSLGWLCPSCRTFMPHEWWTCSRCGQMKLTS